MQDQGMTRYRKKMLQALVARGAEWLDSHIKQGWAATLLGYLGNIVMSDGSACIAGTLVREGFANGLADVSASDRFDSFVEKFGIPHSGGLLGFNIPFALEDAALAPLHDGMQREGSYNSASSADWSVLMEAWEQEILLRVTPEDAAAAIGRMQGELLDVSPDSEAQEALRRAETVLEEREGAVEDAESARDEAQSTYESAQDELNEACSELTTCEEARDEAVDEVETARKALGERSEDKAQRLTDAIKTLDAWLVQRTQLSLPTF